MTEEQYPTVRFRAGALLPSLQERAEGSAISHVAQRDLQRYYSLLALALAQVSLSEGEAGLIIDALNGTWIDPTTAQLLPHEVEDALGDGLAEKWGVDGQSLVERLRRMSLTQRLAICDAAERYWADSYHVDSTADRLLRVGLVKTAV